MAGIDRHPDPPPFKLFLFKQRDAGIGFLIGAHLGLLWLTDLG